MYICLLINWRRHWRVVAAFDSDRLSGSTCSGQRVVIAGRRHADHSLQLQPRHVPTTLRRDRTLDRRSDQLQRRCARSPARLVVILSIGYKRWKISPLLMSNSQFTYRNEFNRRIFERPVEYWQPTLKHAISVKRHRCTGERWY